MTLAADIESGLEGNVNLAAQIASRIYPEYFPADPTFPLLVYNVITDQPDQAMGSGDPILGYRARVQFDIYAQTTDTAHGYNTCQTIRPLLVNALLTLPSDSVNIHERSILGITDIPEANEELFRLMVEGRLVYSE